MKYDYIILGAGASGLMLAYRMANDAFFDDKSVLIIDEVKSKGNDRTWCFWEDGEGEWDALIHKSWSQVFFGSTLFSKTIPISPFNYKMIRSASYYEALWEIIQSKPNITFVEDTFISFTEHNTGVNVNTKRSVYKSTKVFNSIFKSDVYKTQTKYPVIQQHFVGWFVKTNTEVFDDSVATFMDFSVKQNNNTRFMYVLPIDKKTALFEYTLFSKTLLDYSEYEQAIKSYLNQKGIVDYDIIETEKGAIPMTAFKFHKQNTKHILNIGTAGGWTKASTGYTFKNTSKKTVELLEFLKQKDDLRRFHVKTKFWFYDLIFLDVLANHNNEGAALFTAMFKKAKIKTIFKFLDEESSWFQDLKIILAVPPRRFFQALLKRVF